MVHVICLTKSYNYLDFKDWFKWYIKLGCFIHIIDNDSSIPIFDFVSSYLKLGMPYHNDVNLNVTYDKIEGWPNQYKLYEEIMKDNRYGFQENDIIYFLDDDEYLWYKHSTMDVISYPNLEAALDSQFRQLDCVLVPQILISSKNLPSSRNGSLIKDNYYRRNDYTTQGKAFFRYHSDTKYKFFKKNDKENGHVPWINGIRISEVVGSGVSKTTYGITDYTGPVRLYHYHLKSQADWNLKIERGSAAVDHQWYDKDVRKDPYYGGYSVPDFTIAYYADNNYLVDTLVEHAWDEVIKQNNMKNPKMKRIKL